MIHCYKWTLAKNGTSRRERDNLPKEHVDSCEVIDEWEGERRHGEHALSKAEYIAKVTTKKGAWARSPGDTTPRCGEAVLQKQ